MSQQAINVLLVTPGIGSDSSLASALREAEGAQFHTERSADPAEALERLSENGYHALLFDLGTVPGDGLAALVRLRAQARRVPIIVLADASEEALALKTLEAGAQDYLLKPNVHGSLLARCVRYAVERFRLLDELDRHTREWERTRRDLAEGDRSTATAGMYGALSIRQLSREVFDELVGNYTHVLDDAVEERTYRVEHHIGDRLRTLAERLGFLRAGPRDVIEVHTEALRRRGYELSVRRFEPYQIEGRILIVELMGNLVSFYRRYSLAGAPRALAAYPDVVTREDFAQ